LPPVADSLGSAGLESDTHGGPKQVLILAQVFTRRILKLCCAVIALGLLSSIAATYGAADAEGTGEVAPDFALRSLSGGNIRLSEYRGSVVLLGFWARWCGDCRQAMQALDVVNKKYQRAGLVTLSINVGDTEEQAAAMAHSLGLEFPVLVDTSKTASSQFNLKSMPLLLLIDREGRIRQTYAGFERGQEMLITEKLRQLLNE
jgi:peroxiredoxin